MILNIDAKQIEWVGAVWLSQDQTGVKEIVNGYDAHSDNERRFGLPSRLVAKTLLFRIIYGGTGHGFANDPEFSCIGGQRWWDEKITEFYQKYKGLYRWHTELVERVIKSGGKLELPTGRVYEYQAFRGEYPRPAILNYPVQGLAADLVAIVRVSLWKRTKHLRKLGMLFVNTVHDSIVLDIPNELWHNIKVELEDIIQGVFRDVPRNFETLFGVEFNLPVRCDIEVGMDWGNMQPYKEVVNANHSN